MRNMRRGMVQAWNCLSAVWRGLRRWQKAAVGGALAALLAGSAVYLWLFAGLPAIDQLHSGLMLPSTRILDRNGQLLYEIMAQDGGRQYAVPLEAIPQALIDATLATEDRNFYRTPGVDLEGVLRALWINVQGGEVLAGGSTITQQVARNLLLDPDQRAERTLRRKLREMILALRLAGAYSKDEILALYLNQSYYGNLAYGVQAASRVYFNKDVHELDLAECAMLAGLTQLPGIHDPLTNPQAAKDRQRIVLDLMVRNGSLSAEQAEMAAAEPLQFGSGQIAIRAPHFVVAVWEQLKRDYPGPLYQGGLTVATTLDLDWQTLAETVARRHIDDLNHPAAGGISHHASNAALVALDPATGQVRAMLGSVDYFNESISGAVNMAVTPRQPGSTLKPFTYALSFDPNRPDPWTPATMLLDVNTPFVTQRLQSYTPGNYGNVEHGPVLIREALASSYNIPAVIALDHVGLRPLLDFLHRLGISTLNDPTKLDLSVTLGGGEVRLLELTAAYAAFANEGRTVTPRLILDIRDASGAVLYQWTPPASEQILDPRVAYLITDILSDNYARLPAFGDHSPLEIGRPAAAKTGTTTDFRDNWTVGYTPDIVVGVWVGNADNTPMVNVTGVSGAGPIWNEFMRAALRGQPKRGFTRPDGVVQAEVCSASGLLPTGFCPSRRLEWFIEGTTPMQRDTMFQARTIDAATGALATESTPVEQRTTRVYQVLPQEARDYALKHDIEQPPGGAPAADAAQAGQPDALRLIMPDPFTVYQLNPQIPFELQKIRFAAAVPRNTEYVAFMLDGEEIAAAYAEPWWVWWELTPGPHTLTATAHLLDGAQTTSEPIPFSVVSFVQPDNRLLSGEIGP